MSQRKFLVSVVMPVYNTADYLETAIESLIDQTLGFERNIQLILVNDGSEDKSGAICRRYARLYPENVIYKKTHNHGVSAARNYGIKFATGEWVNFMDSDDCWDKEAFKNAMEFAASNNVDLMAGRIKHFEARGDYHVLDYRFENSRVVDVNEEIECLHLSGASCFLRLSEAKKSRFDTTMKFAEDAKYMTDFIMAHGGKYGVVREARYLYRKRRNTNNKSALQQQRQDSFYFRELLQRFHWYLIEKYKDDAGKIPRYIQYVLFYEISWRLFLKDFSCPDMAPKEYADELRKILAFVDDDIIANFRRYKTEHRYFALNFKHGGGLKLEFDNGALYCGEHRMGNYRKRALHLDCLEIRGDKIHVFGRLATILPKAQQELFAQNDNERISLDLKDNPNSRVFSFDGEICKEALFFEFYAPKSAKRISFMCSVLGNEAIRLNINLAKFAKLNVSRKSYYFAGGRIVRLSKDGRSLVLTGATKGRLLKRELIYQLAILYRSRQLKVLLLRDIYWIMRFLQKRPLWVVSDRANMVNDNGEALFRYLRARTSKDLDVVFRLDRKAPDYKRMKKIGKVVNYNCPITKLRMLTADKIISSHIDEYVYWPFPKKYSAWLSDLHDADMVFLQHGITKDDISGWVMRSSKNIKLFVTATEPEYRSIVEGNYLYDEKQVKLVGFARHDRLVAGGKKKKTIIITPTWRKNLAGGFNALDGVRRRNNSFEDSDFFQFYNALINNPRILAVMRKYGYKGEFILHPGLLANAEAFTENDRFEVVKKPIKYSDLLSESALMVSDYSSIAFEFAYLDKPVIYAQFDRDSFFESHIYTEGYFSYEDDGFGPVCYDYESTVAAIIKAIENDCRQPKEYADRVAKTFAYHDSKNCERIYQAILAIDDPCEKSQNAL